MQMIKIKQWFIRDKMYLYKNVKKIIGMSYSTYSIDSENGQTIEGIYLYLKL